MRRFVPMPIVNEERADHARAMAWWGREPVFCEAAEIPVSQLASTQDEVSDLIVEKYMKLLKRSVHLGRIDVAHIGGQFVIVDGHHRAVASHRLKLPFISAMVRVSAKATCDCVCWLCLEGVCTRCHYGCKLAKRDTVDHRPNATACTVCKQNPCSTYCSKQQYPCTNEARDPRAQITPSVGDRASIPSDSADQEWSFSTFVAVARAGGEAIIPGEPGGRDVVVLPARELERIRERAIPGRPDLEAHERKAANAVTYTVNGITVRVVNSADLNAIERILEAEREACAEIAEDHVLHLGESYDARDVAAFGVGTGIAKDIRRRSAPSSGDPGTHDAKEKP